MILCIKSKFLKKIIMGPEKKLRDFMKVEERGVHCKKYNGHCTKQ